MKRVMTALLLTVGIALSFSGCADTVEPEAEISLVLRNATDYALQRIEFVLQEGRYNEWTFVPLVSPEGETLKPGDEREFAFNVPAKSLKSDEWWVIVEALGKEDPYDYDVTISLDGPQGFEITCDDDMNFNFAAADD